jgi:hypothetical protein
MGIPNSSPTLRTIKLDYRLCICPRIKINRFILALSFALKVSLELRGSVKDTILAFWA